MSRLGNRLRSLVPGDALAEPPAWGDGAPRVAVITMVRDEGTMLPLWLRYYAGQVGPDNLYVVDDNSTDGSTEGLDCDVIRVPGVRDGKFESTRMRVISGIADGLLGLYDAVIFCDADEFIVPDPARHRGIVDFVASRAGRPAVGALGYNVVQHLGTETSLDLTAPILAQRAYAVFVPTMCKPSLNYAGAPWVAASHGIRAGYRVDPELFMFHLKFADRDLLHAAAETRRRVVEMDGRSRATSWRRGGDELVGLLEEVSARIDATTPELTVPSGRALERLAIPDPDRDGAVRAPKGGQVKAMESARPVRIPERMRGAF